MSEHLEENLISILGLEVRVTSYPVGQRFSARVDNIDPGSIIGRGMGDTRQEAVANATSSAEGKLHLQASQAELRKSVENLKKPVVTDEN